MHDLDAERQDAIRHFRSTPRACTCKQSGWNFGPTVTLPAAAGGDPVHVMPVRCWHCGATIWLSLDPRPTVPDVSW